MAAATGAALHAVENPHLFIIEAMQTRQDPGQQRTTWEFNITFNNNPNRAGLYMEVRASTLEVALKRIALVAKQYESMNDNEVHEIQSGIKKMHWPKFDELKHQSIQMQANPAGKNMPKVPTRTITWVDTFALFARDKHEQHSIDEDEIKRIEGLARAFTMFPGGSFGHMKYPAHNHHTNFAIVLDPDRS